MNTVLNTADVKTYLLDLQSRIVAKLESLDGKPFGTDTWTRDEGGGGISRVIEEGKLFERAGVLFSHVIGTKLPPTAAANRPEIAGRAWEAMGVSLVLHPRNPFVPTVHLNVRFFIARSSLHAEHDAFWFGGGMDLTPYYGFEEDCVHFHRVNRDALQPFGDDYYPHFKKWCDEYFFLPHRSEPRGVGGIFYDYLDSGDHPGDLAFTRDVGETFLDIYPKLVRRHMNEPWTAAEREHQLVRRGRYVEFNLLHDRGTRFGLMTGGNVEAILMSLPPEARWP